MNCSDKSLQCRVQRRLKAEYRRFAARDAKGLRLWRLPLAAKGHRQKAAKPYGAEEHGPPLDRPQGDSPHQRQRPVANDMLRSRVLQAFAENPQLAPIDLVLAVADGVIFLDGFVQNLKQRRRMERLAAREEGALKVINHLKVVAPPGQSDEDIASELRRVLRPLLPSAGSGLRVEVRQGVAKLKGTLCGRRSSRRIKDAAASVAGVSGIRDQIMTVADKGRCTS